MLGQASHGSEDEGLREDRAQRVGPWYVVISNADCVYVLGVRSVIENVGLDRESRRTDTWRQKAKADSSILTDFSLCRNTSLGISCKIKDMMSNLYVSF